MVRPAKGAKVPGSGRKAGTPNKRTADLQEIVRVKLGKDAVEEMCERYLDCKDSVDDAQRADRLLVEIASYTTPKLKAIEHTGAGGEPLIQQAPLTVEERIALARAVREAKA